MFGCKFTPFMILFIFSELILEVTLWNQLTVNQSSIIDRHIDDKLGFTESPDCSISIGVVHLRTLLTKTNSSTKYSPEYIRLIRCTGCCSTSEKHECKPTKIVFRTLRLTKLKYSVETKRFEPNGVVPLFVDEPRGCMCACRNSGSCNSRFQMFNEKTCACTCTNKSDEARCLKSNLMSWNPETCTCHCVKQPECPAGMALHARKCVCTKVLI